MRALLTGDYETAQRLAGEIFAGADLAPALEPLRDLYDFGLARDRARVEQLEVMVDVGLARQPLMEPWRAALTVAQLELGRLEAAQRVVDEFAANEFAALPRDGLWLSAVAHLAEAAAALGDASSAQLLYRMLRPYQGTEVLVGAYIPFGGSADRYLGLLAVALGRGEAATAHLQSALALNARIDARPWLTRTQLALGRLLLERRESVARKRALALLRLAAASAHELPLPTVAAEIQALLGNGNSLTAR